MVRYSVLAVGINSTKKEKAKIQKELKLDNINLDVASIKEVLFRLKEGKISASIAGKNPSKYDYILIQSGWSTTHMAYLLHLYLKSQKIPHNIPSTQSTDRKSVV